MAMKVRTAAVLFIALFNALWLAHVFVVLALYGYYPIREPVAWFAWGELVLCLLVAGFTVERLLRLRERR